MTAPQPAPTVLVIDIPPGAWLSSNGRYHWAERHNRTRWPRRLSAASACAVRPPGAHAGAITPRPPRRRVNTNRKDHNMNARKIMACAVYAVVVPALVLGAAAAWAVARGVLVYEDWRDETHGGLA